MRQLAVLGEAIGTTRPASPDEPGQLVGPYRLLHELGAGGMATVWLAARDGRSRPVALKLPKPGARRSTARRIARERDILAALDHPGIPRLQDSGSTSEGRSWLAMTHVDGSTIDVRACMYGSRTDERLRSMLQAMAAVAHAHARDIVHGDLKPANILVDRDGAVSVVDFGVARSLRPAAREHARPLPRAFTPAYASPEQLRGETASIAGDIYSLGAVLHTLLRGGRPPLPVTGAARPDESAKPAGASRLPALDAALAEILAKALHPDPAGRYASVDGFAAAIELYLVR